MSEVSAGVLQQQVAQIQRIEQQDKWFKKSELGKLQQQIHEAFSALPMPVARLDEFDNCRVDYHLCLQWLQQGLRRVEQRNRQWTERMLEQHHDFFQTVESSPLNDSQSRAVVNGEDSVLVLAGPAAAKRRCWWRAPAGCCAVRRRNRGKSCCWRSAAVLPVK